MNKNYFYTALAIGTITIWGTTFVSTKLLLEFLSPVQIMLFRYLIGYAALFLFYPRLHRVENARQELLYLAAAVSGSTLYFLSENYALSFTQASNVSLLVSAAPILTALIAHLFTRDERFGRSAMYGFFAAFAGIFLVVCNGHFVLQLSPIGDLLALIAALCWACYSIIIRKLTSKFPLTYITRRIFFYAIITMLPSLLLPGSKPLSAEVMLNPLVWGNLLFLGVGACAICFVTWSHVIRYMGAVRANNFIYFNPLVTMIASVIVLHERITPLMLLGAALVLAGVVLADGTLLRRVRELPPT